MSMEQIAGNSVVAAVVGAACIAFPGGSVSGQDATAEIAISGTSTVRNWTCYVSAPVEIASDDSAPSAPGFEEGVRSVTVTVQVAEIECPEEDMMEHLQEAMQAERYPEIVYRMDGYTVGSGNVVSTTGTLSMVGTTNPVEMEMGLDPSGSAVQVEGEVRVDMREWGIEPPRVLAGLLQVGPEVRLEFEASVP